MIISTDGITPSSAGAPKTGRARLLAAVFLGVALSLSGLYLRYAWNRYQSMASSEAIMLAQSLEALLHPEHIAALSGSAEDLQKTEYVMFKKNLLQLIETTNPIRFAYLMGERNGSVIMLVDSEPADSPDYSPPGQVYTEADEDTLKPFRLGETFLTGPTADRWGTWISVLVPVKDSGGKVVAVFGIDYDASEWYSDLWRQMLPDGIIIMTLLLLVFALFRTWDQHFSLRDLSRKLTYNEALYHNVFENAPIGIAISYNDGEGDIGHDDFSVNAMYEQITGRTREELQELGWTKITYPDDLEEDIENLRRLKAGEIEGYSMNKRFLKPDGSVVWTHMVVTALNVRNLSQHEHICLIQDITKQKEAEEARAESERSKSVLLSHLPGLAYRCRYDRKWTMQYVSAGCYALTGYPPESLVDNRDLSFNEVIAPGYREALWKHWERTLSKLQPFRHEYEIISAQGERKWVLEIGQGIYNEQGEAEALEGIILDISDRKNVENQLRYNGEHDLWTGLYNRRYLEDLLRRDAKSYSGKKRAVVSVNLTSMYLLSLTYGFHYSQDLIKKVAEALKGYCSRSRHLFNTYEYRFVYYIKGYKDRTELETFCEEVEGTLESILALEKIGGGIGVVEIDGNGREDVDQMLKNLLIASEKAMHTMDKDIGICFFDEEMREHISREEIISRELTQIAGGEKTERLFLQYQPILDLESNRICGFEALARLNSEQLGRVPPLEFIPIAEKTKLIIPLGSEIILKAFHFSNVLRENGHPTVGVTINISAIQLMRHDFTENLIETAERMQIDPAYVILEITESVFATNYQEINRILGRLKEFGFRIAIDDFGTEYSSLARERELNVNCLKIDKCFIDQLLTLEPEQAITEDIISMGHKLGHSIIAEGIEYEKQLQYLRNHGCDKIQGYLIGKPLDEEAALELIKDQQDVDADCFVKPGCCRKEEEPCRE